MQKYTEAIATDPTEPTFYCNRAAVFTKRNEYQNAINDCEKAITLDPVYATAYSRLGYAFFQLGQVDRAREAYQRGLRACPDNQALKDNLSSIPPEQGAPAPPPGTGNSDFLSGLFGAFANNPAMMGQIMEKMNSPEVQTVLQDPEMAAFVDEIKANPAAIFSKMGDPRLQKLMAIVMGSGPR
jgi:tetratricopeptide (TPR) repeat protein